MKKDCNVKLAAFDEWIKLNNSAKVNYFKDRTCAEKIARDNNIPFGRRLEKEREAPMVHVNTSHHGRALQARVEADLNAIYIGRSQKLSNIADALRPLRAIGEALQSVVDGPVGQAIQVLFTGLSELTSVVNQITAAFAPLADIFDILKAIFDQVWPEWSCKTLSITLHTSLRYHYCGCRTFIAKSRLHHFYALLTNLNLHRLIVELLV